MKKMDYKHGTFTLATNEVDQFTYEEYEDFCEDNGIEPGTDTSEEFYEWCAEEAANNWDCDMDNIRACKQYNVPCIITGSLGLWDGRHTIQPERMESVYDAIQRCIGGRGIDESVVQWVDGEIIVDAYHHDGVNIFTIRALSKKGIAKQYAEYKPYDTKRLPYLYAIGI